MEINSTVKIPVHAGMGINIKRIGWQTGTLLAVDDNLKRATVLIDGAEVSIPLGNVFEMTPGFDHKGALPVLRQLDAAIYAGIICNPAHGLTPEQFDAIAAAHSEALKVFRCVEGFAKV